MAKEKAGVKTETKKSVNSYQQDIGAEKQKMADYSKRMKTNVRSLQTKFKGCSNDLRESANKLREQGIKDMAEKVGKFKGEIRAQIKENRESVSHMHDNINYYLSEINRKKKDFQAYARGPFNDSIKAFWG